MKKHILFALVFVFVFAFSFFNFNVVSMSAYDTEESGCISPTFKYSITTGQPCNTTATTGCLTGYLFNPFTGKPCSTVSVPTVFCHTLNNNLSIWRGSGDDVSALVTILVKEGLMAERSSNFSNTFDEQVATGVVKFQGKYGLSQDGYVGPLTRAKLNALYGCGIVQPPIPISTSVVINGVSGPQSLNVNQQGTWKVTAYDRNGGNLSYSVFWDDQTGNPGSLSGIPLAEPQQSATFTHTYFQSGNHTPAFYVTNNAGQSAKTSLSVNVGNVTSSDSITVLSPNGKEAWAKGTAQTIKWQDNTINLSCTTNEVSCGVAYYLYDIKLLPEPIGCLTCTKRPPTPIYVINKNVDGLAYLWFVGKIADYGGIAPDGAYTIQVCQSGSTTCDLSDGLFEIISAIPALPPISVFPYDYNADGKQDDKDIAILLRVVVNLQACPVKTCDVNDDGAVNNLDLIKLYTIFYDYSGDNVLTSVDTAILLRIVTNLQSCPPSRTCDINGDGLTDNLDLIRFNQIVGIPATVSLQSPSLMSASAVCAIGDLFSFISGQLCR